MSVASTVSKFSKRHWVSLSLLLAVYGAVYFSSVVLSGWTLSDWGKNLPEYPLMVTPLLPSAWIQPAFYVTSIPALLIGTISLCTYSIRNINPNIIDNKEHIAILLTACGFTYVVIGAWPLGNPVSFPWQWQKDIIGNGAVVAWMLYTLSLATLLIGAASLFIHSRIYHQNNPEASLKLSCKST